MKPFLLSLLVVIVLLVGGLVLFVYSGMYNIAAVADHTAVEKWALETAKRASVERRAADIEVPDLVGREMISRGAGSYAAMCATCHGAPGVERTAMGRGLNPTAPEPEEMLRVWSSAELFWVTKNGIRMTGMPAWGPTHTDDQLWEIVAFMLHMEDMTPAEYAEMIAEAPAHDHQHNHDHENGHDHDHDHEHDHHGQNAR